jgi:SRSO17 transposase
MWVSMRRGIAKRARRPTMPPAKSIGNLHGLANGVVSVNAYGVLDTLTFPLTFPLAFRFFKPKSRLKAGDVYKTKPQLAIELVQRLLALGFRFSVVLADSLYGESGEFVSALHRLGLRSVVAIRSHHGVWTFPGQRVRRPPLATGRARL